MLFITDVVELILCLQFYRYVVIYANQFLNGSKYRGLCQTRNTHKNGTLFGHIDSGSQQNIT